MSRLRYGEPSLATRKLGKAVLIDRPREFTITFTNPRLSASGLDLGWVPSKLPLLAWTVYAGTLILYENQRAWPALLRSRVFRPENR